MHAVVIGGSGQIGGWLLRVLAGRGHTAVGTYATTPFPNLIRLDAAELSSADWLKAQRPDVVFYPAGFTWVDGCERDPDRARAANLFQPLNLARVAGALGARFVSFSTDYVFDGRSGPYMETDPANPLSVYGRAKLESEQALTLESPGCLVVRTTWVYGPERQGKNFAYQLVKGLGDGRPFVCPSDQISTPSYGPDVARAVVALVEAGETGLIHVAGPEVIDRVDFARSLARGFGLDPTLVVGRPTGELGQQAQRPLNGGLLTPRLDSLLPGFMRPISPCLEDFRARLDEPGGFVCPLALP